MFSKKETYEDEVEPLALGVEDVEPDAAGVVAGVVVGDVAEGLDALADALPEVLLPAAELPAADDEPVKQPASPKPNE